MVGTKMYDGRAAAPKCLTARLCSSRRFRVTLRSLSAVADRRAFDIAMLVALRAERDCKFFSWRQKNFLSCQQKKLPIGC